MANISDDGLIANHLTVFIANDISGEQDIQNLALLGPEPGLKVYDDAMFQQLLAEAHQISRLHEELGRRIHGQQRIFAWVTQEGNPSGIDIHYLSLGIGHQNHILAALENGSVLFFRGLQVS